MNPDEILVSLDEHELILKERKIVVGIGCRRGKECIKIYDGLIKSINDLNIEKSRINMLASAEIKKDEEGILELSDKLNIPINFVELDKLKLFKDNGVNRLSFGVESFDRDVLKILGRNHDEEMIFNNIKLSKFKRINSNI